MSPSPVVQIGSAADAETDPNKRLRLIWAERLNEQLEFLKLTPKRFCRLLEDEGDLEVSLQTVYAWLSGAWAPSPAKQGTIAKVLGAPPQRLFPVDG